MDQGNQNRRGAPRGNGRRRFSGSSINGRAQSQSGLQQEAGRVNHNRQPREGNGRGREGNDQNSGRRIGRNNYETVNEPNRTERTHKPMGFRTLEDIANSEDANVLTKVSDKSNSFLLLLNSDVDKLDMFALIIKVIAKVGRSSFEELKQKVLLNTCNSRLIGNLQNYLITLPFVSRADQKKNVLYWKNPNDFWENLYCFCKSVVLLSPTTAMMKLRSLIESVTRVCLDGLTERHNFSLPPELALSLHNLRLNLLDCEKEEEKKVENARCCFVAHDIGEPPENFRQISIIPSREDFLNERPFLRPNIKQGAYQDVEHYLDVQFRLLREDFVGPLREGILQYMKDPNRRKFDNIRVYTGVKFVEPYVSQNKIGEIIKFNNKKLKKINWAHSKRLIFGSLLLFTRIEFRDIIIATVLDRDLNLLDQGKVPVSLINETEESMRMLRDETFIMVESEVYFEPYYHVLKALQDPDVTRHIAMSKYIINVDPVPRNPAYLTLGSEYKIEYKIVYPLQEATWPSSYELKLNDTQYEAYKLALTHEFAVIQGPPGTGKTYLGLKVAKTLLCNLKPIRLLLICFTNHALDQFLEAILNVTKSVVRIGGQSRSETLKDYNLANVRRNQGHRRDGFSTYNQQKIELEQCINKMKRIRKTIDEANNGVLKYDIIKTLVPEINILNTFYDKALSKDVLFQWLFENVEYNSQNEENDIEINNFVHQAEADDDDDDDDPLRMDLDLDDYETEESTSFDLNKVMSEIKLLKCNIKKSAKTNQMFSQHLLHEKMLLDGLVQRFKDMSPFKHDVSEINIDNHRDPRNFTIPVRWTMYFTWAKKFVNTLTEEINLVKIEYESSNTAYEESRMMMDLSVLNKVKVVGMTTSAAARLKKMLQTWAPNIVIVEEAAEVLESHIITALTRHCQHLILIGDHQQLRPSAAHFKLARDYNMEVSLFERMINNGIHCRQLGVQHRMRPEIASLITPAIYSNLLNDKSVESFPQVRGVANNLFFLSHNFKENAVEDSSSRCNAEEADLTLSLANYLMQQGYKPEDVTILAAYSGQMFYMKKQRQQYAFLSKIKLTVVDNYQGEESKIILLSLVRNNDDNRIGFLSTVNRVCVALSRAREGFYMIGNIDILKRNAEIWTKVAATLENHGSLGTNINLHCENHPDQISSVKCAKDFEKVPEGGCLLKCDFNLNCGHVCPLICHGYDRGHNLIKCPRNCDRILCELGHVCPLKCADDCGPCRTMVLKTLPCKHTVEVPCHQDPKDPNLRCRTTIDVRLLDCGHEAKKPCYLQIKLVKCTIPCKSRVDPCGHQCRLTCHVGEDPDHKNYLCEKPCARAKKGCKAELEGNHGDHQCNKRCHEECDDCKVQVKKQRSSCKHLETVLCCENVDLKPCPKKCARSLPCGHFCKKRCFEPCGDCKQQVIKVIPECGHATSVECKTEPTRQNCNSKCERILSCGHNCTDSCKNICDRGRCVVIVQQDLLAKCGHTVRLPCNVYNSLDKDYVSSEALLLKHCTAPCGKELACGHLCSGTCGQCLQGRLHVLCTQTCHKLFICGHQCKEPCNQLCPPCKQRCIVACSHTKCNKICGDPCVPCAEKCKRRCFHSSCSSLCGEACSRAACNEPCRKLLACKHRCRGLCGEPCPDICNICRPDDFPKDFLGDDFEDTDKFVKLEDCPHVLEVENMDNLMMADQETVGVKTCPFCRTPIVNTHRYKDLINKKLKNEINPIKEKVYGNKQNIQDEQIQLKLKFQSFVQLYQKLLRDNMKFKQAYNKIRSVLIALDVRKINVSLLQLNMYSAYLNIMELIAKTYMEHENKNSTVLLRELENQTELLCDAIIYNMQKISQQQRDDIEVEIQRMQAIVQLSIIIGNEAYSASKSQPNVLTATTHAKEAIFTWRVFQEDAALTALKELQNAVKISGVLTVQERAQIVKAIDLKQGHWFKCPNGHYYCIGECGGAMQVGRCVECGAAIGGSHHRLLGDNQLAGEMDGAHHAAWSDVANNMANFRL